MILLRYLIRSEECWKDYIPSILIFEIDRYLFALYALAHVEEHFNWHNLLTNEDVFALVIIQHLNLNLITSSRSDLFYPEFKHGIPNWRVACFNHHISLKLLPQVLNHNIRVQPVETAISRLCVNKIAFLNFDLHQSLRKLMHIAFAISASKFFFINFNQHFASRLSIFVV